MSLIDVSKLTFAYEGSYDNIFENVSFQIDSDWRLGFTGRNGRGKTTFLNLLLGKYRYSGTIAASVSFDYFPFNIADKKQKDTLAVINSVHADFEPWQLYKELSLLEVPEEVLYRPFFTLSNGEQTKILLATLFLKENRFLLIDEPTNHLDLQARKIVGNYLKSKKGFILVSHDRTFLDNCIDHILSINKNNIEIQKGNFSSWWLNKERQDNFELAENKRLQKNIQHLAEAAKNTANWSDKVEKTKFGSLNSGIKPDKGHIGHLAAKMMKRSKATKTRQQKAINQKSALLKNIETADSLSIQPLTYQTNRLVELRNLTIAYEQTVCENVGFTINRGDRLALTGKNGSGKSSILKLLLGQNIPYTGETYIGSKLITSYVSQDTSFLEGNLKDFALTYQIDESLFKAILRKLDFSRTQFDKDIRDFSEGQKKKVLIAKSLCQQAHLYIWDEPLNFIDVLSRIQIEQMLRRHTPTMIFVEHDSAFIDAIATKRVQL